MANERYYLGPGDWNDDTKWSLTSGGAGGASFPTGANPAIFDDNSGDCTLDANAAALSITIGTVGKLYTGTLDFNTSDFALGSGGLDTEFGENAELDFGTGTFTITDGTFDYSGIGTFNDDTSTIEFVGTCGWIAKSAAVRTVSIVSGTTTLTGGPVDVQVLLAVGNDATLLCNGRVNIRSCNLTTGTNSRLGGTNILYITNVGTGEGYTSRGAGTTFDVAQFSLSPKATSPSLPAGVYSSTVRIYNNDPIDALLTLDSGAYAFDSLELDSIGDTAPIILDVKTNSPTVTVAGELLFDINNAADITVDGDGGSAEWILQGDVTYSPAAAGVLVWNKGSGTITLSGAADQDIDFGGEAVEDIVINKSAGNLVLTGGVQTDSFDGISTGLGDFDPNGQDITIDGDCDWAAAFVFDAAATVMNGSNWVVDGNFTADGQSLKADAPWTLQVAGTAVASGTGDVAYCNADDTHTRIGASAGPWTDNGNNTNWSFSKIAIFMHHYQQLAGAC